MAAPDRLADWIVFFGPGAGAAPWWVRATTRPAWRHCFACAFDPARDAWIVVWPSWRAMEIRLVPAHWIDGWAAAAKRGQYRALAVTVAPEGPPRFKVTLGCAGAIGWLLGLSGRQLRPAALYRTLLARGAQPVFLPAGDPA